TLRPDFPLSNSPVYSFEPCLATLHEYFISKFSVYRFNTRFSLSLLSCLAFSSNCLPRGGSQFLTVIILLCGAVSIETRNPHLYHHLLLSVDIVYISTGDSQTRRSCLIQFRYASFTLS